MAAAPAQAITPTTATFTYTGAEQTFKVPGGVHSVEVLAIGGSGGAAGTVLGGVAAEVFGSVSVTPGQTLYVEVGGKGKDSGEGGEGGFNGGGNGGGGGGGASDVRTSALAAGLSPDTRLIVAAGGGGGGSSGEGAGGAGGPAGSEGGASEGGYSGGGAGTETEGGLGASGCEIIGTGGNGELGSGGHGGNSGLATGPGGGGGGGYYGGGGGGGACFVGSSGGGGGSSKVPLGGSLELASPSAAPKIEFTYTLVPPTIEIVSPASGGTYTQGEVVSASYSCTPPEGTTVEECEGPVASGSPFDTSTLGSHSFTVNAEDKDGATASEEVTYTVVAPPSISITTPANGAVYTQGEIVSASYSCTPAGGTSVVSCEGPVANGAALDTTSLGPHAFTVGAEDADGGTATKKVTYTVVASPSISITTPANGAAYTKGQAVAAIYSCAPAGGTGVKTCAGTVANGAAIDTSTLGSHSFTVNAEDTDGGKATREVTYTVIAPPPAPSTTLKSHPKPKLKTKKKKTKVSFSFSSDTAGATFKCKLDKGSFAPCTSPKKYKVKLGKHTFSVEAVSAAGTDSTPATFSFKVVKKKP